MKNLPIWVLLFLTFGQAAMDKILGGSVPAWFVEQFRETFMATLPGLPIAYYTILVLELATAVLIAAGIAKREFLSAEKPLLTSGYVLAQLTFIALGFGQRLTHKYDQAAQLFFYAALTYIAGHIALKHPDRSHVS